MTARSADQDERTNGIESVSAAPIANIGTDEATNKYSTDDAAFVSTWMDACSADSAAFVSAQTDAHGSADGVVSDSTQPNACPANAAILAVTQSDLSLADGVVSDSTQPNACPANATIAAVIQADPSLAAGVVLDNTQTEALTQADAFSPQR